MDDDALALAESLAARTEADPSNVDGRAVDGYDDVRASCTCGEAPPEREGRRQPRQCTRR